MSPVTKEKVCLEEVAGLDVAEQIFWESVSWNKQLSKKKSKPKMRGIKHAVTPEAVLKAVSEWGIRMDIRTLQRWTTAQLIPRPERRSAGRGKGRVTDYPDTTPAELAASFLLCKQMGIAHDDAALCRQVAVLVETKAKALGESPADAFQWMRENSLAPLFDGNLLRCEYAPFEEAGIRTIRIMGTWLRMAETWLREKMLKEGPEYPAATQKDLAENAFEEEIVTLRDLLIERPLK